MNNLSSYYGLTDSRMSASEKDLPVPTQKKPVCFQTTISLKYVDFSSKILRFKNQTACLKISKCSPGRVIKVYTILTRYIGASHKMPVRTKKNDPIMVACEHKVSSNIGAILSKCNAILHSQRCR